MMCKHILHPSRHSLSDGLKLKIPPDCFVLEMKREHIVGLGHFGGSYVVWGSSVCGGGGVGRYA